MSQRMTWRGWGWEVLTHLLTRSVRSTAFAVSVIREKLTSQTNQNFCLSEYATNQMNKQVTNREK